MNSRDYVDYAKELKRVRNSIVAYTNITDCSNKTAVDIEVGSYHALESCFEHILYDESEGTKSFLKNTSLVLGAIVSLGGSYTLALQQKHYSDIYKTLYKPSITELDKLQKITNNELSAIGEEFERYNILTTKAEKILNKALFKYESDNVKAMTLLRIRKFNSGYNTTIATGFAGLIGGSTALGAWAVVSVIGSASTGTAIASLSGIAATNATLAWFGGGSLCSGIVNLVT
jgi:hypothetical protein